MKENVIVEFAFHKVQYEKNGSTMTANDTMCFRIVHPADEKFKYEETNFSMNKNAKKDLLKFLRLADHKRKSIIFIGTYEEKNSMNFLHLIRAMKCKSAEEAVISYLT
jgi:hypothetical protein